MLNQRINATGNPIALLMATADYWEINWLLRTMNEDLPCYMRLLFKISKIVMSKCVLLRIPLLGQYFISLCLTLIKENYKALHSANNFSFHMIVLISFLLSVILSVVTIIPVFPKDISFRLNNRWKFFLLNGSFI